MTAVASIITSNTQWCGLGADNAVTPCPDPSKNFDFHADDVFPYMIMVKKL